MRKIELLCTLQKTMHPPLDGKFLQFASPSNFFIQNFFPTPLETLENCRNFSIE